MCSLQTLLLALVVCAFQMVTGSCIANCLDVNCKDSNVCKTCSPNWEGDSCDVPAGCMHQAVESATCEFYTRCLYSQKNCPYVHSIMYSKCVEYHDLARHFSPEGQEWAASVTSCIQNKLSDRVLAPLGSNYSCAMLYDVFFSEHVDCYLHSSRHSFCTIPLWDQVRVVATGASMVVLPATFWPSIRSAIELFQACNLRIGRAASAGEEYELTHTQCHT